MIHSPFRHGRVAPSGQLLRHADGTPFFWLADTAWELFHRLTREEAIYFLDTRCAQQFNVIQAVALAEFDGLRTPNRYGELALHDQDPTRPNETYFTHIDWVIARAAERGLYIALLPTWGDKVVRHAWGDGPIVFDAANARGYAQWLGRRYATQENVMWVMGGDRRAIHTHAGGDDDYRPLWAAMAQGIRAGGSDALITYHPPGGRDSRSGAQLHDAPWLQLNMMQSGHGSGRDVPVWEWVTADLALTPAKPTLDGEPNYEDHPVNPWPPPWDPANGYFRDHDVRKQMWRSVLAGGCGVTYGHHAVWQFFDPALKPVVNHADRTWREAIARPAAQQVRHLRALIERLDSTGSRVPDQALLAHDAGARGSHVRCMRDAARAWAIAYVPNTQTVNIAANSIAGASMHASWYDPRTGASTPIGEFNAAKPRAFTTPDHGPDWVLVLT